MPIAVLRLASGVVQERSNTSGRVAAAGGVVYERRNGPVAVWRPGGIV